MVGQSFRSASVVSSTVHNDSMRDDWGRQTDMGMPLRWTMRLRADISVALRAVLRGCNARQYGLTVSDRRAT